MSSPTIKGIGITQHVSPASWKATGYVDGIGWLGSLGHQPDRGNGGDTSAGRAVHY